MLDHPYTPPPDATAVPMSYEDAFQLALDEQFEAMNVSTAAEHDETVFGPASEDIDGFLEEDIVVFFGVYCTRNEAVDAAIEARCPAAITMAICRTDDQLNPDLFHERPGAMEPSAVRLARATKRVQLCAERAHTRAAKITGLNP